MDTQADTRTHIQTHRRRQSLYPRISYCRRRHI